MSYEEIAAVTGLKLGTVRSRINRGRAHFKKMVAPFVAKDFEHKGERNMKCTKAQDLYFLSRDDALDEAGGIELARHLAHCPRAGCS